MKKILIDELQKIIAAHQERRAKVIDYDFRTCQEKKFAGQVIKSSSERIHQEAKSVSNSLLQVRHLFVLSEADKRS